MMYKPGQIGKNTDILSVFNDTETRFVMKRKKNKLIKEKIVMISASAFVLTAMTMAGVYMREQSKESDEYRVDLSELDNRSVAEKTNEIAEKMDFNEENMIVADDLDADPSFYEAGSPKVEGILANSNEKVTAQEAGEEEGGVAENSTGSEVVTAEENITQEAGAENVITANYNFPLQMELTWPLYGDLLMNYSMDKTVFFKTLGQYRYNPALVIKAEVGSDVTASATGVVKEVFNSKELGTVVIMDIGEGYELTYGQLENVMVCEGDVVETGASIGTVANPSVYYSVEGSNLYFKMTKDGVAMNPMDVLP